MKSEAVCVVQFAVACKFAATALTCPFLAGGEQLSGSALTAAVLFHENAFQIADGARARTLHIIAPQLALGKSDGSVSFLQEEELRILIGQEGREFFLQLLRFMMAPEQ